jgi:hypothetical protein
VFGRPHMSYGSMRGRELVLTFNTNHELLYL